MYQCERRDCVRWFEFDSIEDPIVWYYSSKVHQTHKPLSIPNKGNCNSILIRNPLKWRWHFRAKLFSCPPHPSILFEKKIKDHTFRYQLRISHTFLVKGQHLNLKLRYLTHLQTEIRPYIHGSIYNWCYFYWSLLQCPPMKLYYIRFVRSECKKIERNHPLISLDSRLVHRDTWKNPGRFLPNLYHLDSFQTVKRTLI